MTVHEGVKAQIFWGGGYVEVMKSLLAAVKGDLVTCQYAWFWYPHSSGRRVHQITLAALAAVHRGVKMRVILNREAPGARLTRENAITASVLGKAGVPVRFGSPGVSDHAKFWVLDGRVVVISSHNLTTRSVTCNSELGVALESELVARDVLQYFDRLWGRG